MRPNAACSVFQISFVKNGGGIVSGTVYHFGPAWYSKDRGYNVHYIIIIKVEKRIVHTAFIIIVSLFF